MAIGSMDDARLRRAFLEDAEELSLKLGESLLALETDRSNPSLLNEIFRLTHSLKSESALMGFTTLSVLAHRMEDVLGLARDGTLAMEKQAMDGVFAGADLIAEMMAAISKGGSDADFDTRAALDELAAVMSQGGDAGGTPAVPADAAGHAVPAVPAGMPVAVDDNSTPAAHPAATDSALVLGEFEKHQLAEARDRGEGLYRLTFVVDKEESMKFPRAYLVFSNLELVSNVVKVVPSMDGEPVDDAAYATTTVLLTQSGGEDALRSAASVDQIAVSQIETIDYAALLAPAGAASKPGAHEQKAIEHALSSEPAAGTSPGETPPAAAAAPATAAGTPPAAAAEKTSIRVDTRKLDDLWSLIAELVLHKSHIARLSEAIGRGADVHTVKEELVESFDSLDKISGGMQQAMMDTRMIPISVIFSKFPRLVRDLSRKLGKPVELVLAGEDTEIDRSVVEALSDPLTHIIRNSLDHGLEFPEERVRQGKAEKGRVNVAARRQGGTIVIELSDDGRGMDTERIREKAIARGIAGAQSFSEAQLLDLVFLPGFSTKDVVTDLSGRGVGMDVVATRIRGDLKGDVSLRTEQGRGTRVTLMLPLTLTIVNALLVRGEAQLYAIPLTDVDSTAKVPADDITGEPGRESSTWMGEEIPLFSLGALFAAGRPKAEEYFAAVLRQGERKAFLVVDELIEEREVVIKPVDDLLNSQRLFSGVSVLEDGRLVFILDTSFIRRENF
jgi:two-component system chemotaxis sensor kinase CheA